MRSIITIIFTLLIEIAFIVKALGQEYPAHFIGFNYGINNPIGNYASGNGTNFLAIPISFSNRESQNSGTSLLLPPQTGQIIRVDGGYYLYKKLWAGR